MVCPALSVWQKVRCWSIGSSKMGTQKNTQKSVTVQQFDGKNEPKWFHPQLLRKLNKHTCGDFELSLVCMLCQ